MDADGDGVIDYKEFIASSLSLFQVARGVLPTQRALWYNRLRVVFNELDKDCNGSVSAEELLRVCPDRDEVKKAIQVPLSTMLCLHLCARLYPGMLICSVVSGLRLQVS
jgi:hypothetical protein